VLAVENINKSFYHNPVLRNLSFGVNNGDAIALTGKNGAGKSTLLRILARISQPDAGTVVYNDVDIFKAQASARSGILYLGHEPGLYPALSAIENIEFARRIHGAPPASEDIITTLKNIGLSEQINDPIKIYSKGMLQRLKYALANSLPWSILFFDEPFSGLDIEGKSLALDCLNAWKANDRTMIFVTHDVEWGLSFCNRLFLLEEGNLKIDQSAGNIDVKTIVSGLQ
jgi:ABC-type multidrug transport system ATPase subunit